MKTIILLAATASLCISSIATAAEINVAAGTVRQEVDQNVNAANGDSDASIRGTVGSTGEPDAWPHHNPMTRWQWHRKNTTTKLVARPANPDAIPQKAGFYHQVTSRWSRHYQNSTSPAPK